MRNFARHLRCPTLGLAIKLEWMVMDDCDPKPIAYFGSFFQESLKVCSGVVEIIFLHLTAREISAFR
jgi:hypothetical protein